MKDDKEPQPVNTWMKFGVWPPVYAEDGEGPPPPKKSVGRPRKHNTGLLPADLKQRSIRSRPSGVMSIEVAISMSNTNGRHISSYELLDAMMRLIDESVAMRSKSDGFLRRAVRLGVRLQRRMNEGES